MTVAPGQPADDFGAAIDGYFGGRTPQTAPLRHAIIDAAEDFLNDTLAAGVNVGVITADQAAMLKTLAAGPPPNGGLRPVR